jgi:hypothetical protein
MHAQAYGQPEARVVGVRHPLAAIAPEEIVQRADAVVEQIIERLMAAH